jgi:hypothetical protein
MRELKVGLIKGRHELPVTNYIFEGDIANPLAFGDLFRLANRRVIEIVGAEGDNFNLKEDKLVLYVTGLTQATAAVINACINNKVRLDLAHFDRDTNTYKMQEIFTEGCDE